MLGMWLVGLAMAAAGANDTPREAKFTVADVQLMLPLPAGYCEPSGKGVMVAQMIGAADSQNVTDLAVFRCDEAFAPGVGDYTLIKTVKTLLVMKLDRTDFLKQLGDAFNQPALIAALESDATMAKPSEDIGTVLGTKVTLQNALKPMGHDDVCAYMGGAVTLNAQAITFTQPLGMCMTVVGGKMLSIIRYGKDGSPAGVRALMRETRAIALSIHPADAK